MQLELEESFNMQRIYFNVIKSHVNSSIQNVLNVWYENIDFDNPFVLTQMQYELAKIIKQNKTRTIPTQIDTIMTSFILIFELLPSDTNYIIRLVFVVFEAIFDSMR